jgi:hypothetical protein
VKRFRSFDPSGAGVPQLEIRGHFAGRVVVRSGLYRQVGT